MGASSRSSAFSVSRLLYAAVPDMLLLDSTCVQSPLPGLHRFPLASMHGGLITLTGSAILQRFADLISPVHESPSYRAWGSWAQASIVASKAAQLHHEAFMQAPTNA